MAVVLAVIGVLPSGCTAAELASIQLKLSSQNIVPRPQKTLAKHVLASALFLDLLGRPRPSR